MCLRVEDYYTLRRGKKRAEIPEWSDANNSRTTSHSKKTITPSVVFTDRVHKKETVQMLESTHQLNLNFLEGPPNLQTQESYGFIYIYGVEGNPLKQYVQIIYIKKCFMS